jgi:hypothetical protein
MGCDSRKFHNLSSFPQKTILNKMLVPPQPDPWLLDMDRKIEIFLMC